MLDARSLPIQVATSDEQRHGGGVVLTEAEEVHADLIREPNGFERAADRLGCGAVAAVGGAGVLPKL